MTTIVVVRKGASAVIAADSLTTFGTTRLAPAYDRSPRPLTEKILERPRLVERIRAAVPDIDRAYLTVFRATPLERRRAACAEQHRRVGLDLEPLPLGDRLLDRSTEPDVRLGVAELCVAGHRHGHLVCGPGRLAGRGLVRHQVLDRLALEADERRHPERDPVVGERGGLAAVEAGPRHAPSEATGCAGARSA